MPFQSITFWCEFPEKVNWEAFQKLIDFPCSVYIASRSRKDFIKKSKEVNSKYISVGVWPILPHKEGYWFSGLVSEKSIDFLKEFEGLKVKIDIETPLKIKKICLSLYIVTVFDLLFRIHDNKEYLKKTIRKLSKKTEIIMSSYPLPRWISKFYGGDIQVSRNIKKNYFIYTSYFSQPFKSILYHYYRWFIKKKLKEEGDNIMFALGCIGTGIFGNEIIYKNVEEFRKDLMMFSHLGVKHLVVFEVKGIMQREHPEEWIQAIKDYL